MYYQYRCNQIEWLDYSADIEDWSPSACNNPDALALALRNGSLKDEVYKTIANNRMTILTQGNCCPCPQTQSSIITKVANCQAATISWDLPNGSRTSISYDLTQPWSYYLGLINSSWFPLAPPTPYAGAVVTVAPCLNYGCCYRIRTYCKNPPGNVSFWDGPWLMQGPPCSDPVYQNCQVINCGN